MSNPRLMPTLNSLLPEFDLERAIFGDDGPDDDPWWHPEGPGEEEPDDE